MAKHIQKLDIDERLINFINQISKEYNLNINARVFNALEEVPHELKHKFDCLITDPTPEVIPFTIFMNDAIDLLKKDNIPFNEDSICFTESLFRLKITNKTKKIKLNYQGKDIFGKVTKRVIKDKNNDIVSYDEYLDKVEIEMKKNSLKKYISK